MTQNPNIFKVVCVWTSSVASSLRFLGGKVHTFGNTYPKGLISQGFFLQL